MACNPKTDGTGPMNLVTLIVTIMGHSRFLIMSELMIVSLTYGRCKKRPTLDLNCVDTTVDRKIDR